MEESYDDQPLIAVKEEDEIASNALGEQLDDEDEDDEDDDDENDEQPVMFINEEHQYIEQVHQENDEIVEQAEIEVD